MITKNNLNVLEMQQAIREGREEDAENYLQEMRRGIAKALESLQGVQQTNIQQFHELVEQVEEEPRVISKAELRRKSIKLYRDADKTLIMARKLKKLIREAL